jgi:hypothetical protein
VPDEVYDKLIVPSLDNLKLREIKQYNSYCEDHREKMKRLIDFSNLEHIQLQVDDLKNTSFVQVEKSLESYIIFIEL